MLGLWEGVDEGRGFEVGWLEVERGGRGMNVARPAWISKRCCVDVHVRDYRCVGVVNGARVEGMLDRKGIDTKLVSMLSRLGQAC